MSQHASKTGKCYHPDHDHPDDFARATCWEHFEEGYTLELLCPCCGEITPCADRCFTSDETLDGEADAEC